MGSNSCGGGGAIGSEASGIIGARGTAVVCGVSGVGLVSIGGLGLGLGSTRGTTGASQHFPQRFPIGCPLPVYDLLRKRGEPRGVCIRTGPQICMYGSVECTSEYAVLCRFETTLQTAEEYRMCVPNSNQSCRGEPFSPAHMLTCKRAGDPG